MAYARRTTRRTRRTYRKRTRYAKKRTSPKRRYTRKATTKKRILNVTSEKKRDSMIMAVRPDPITGVDPGTGLGPTLFNSVDGAIFAFGFQATCRTNENIPGVPGSKYDSGCRTSTTPFMRGIQENITLETEDAGAYLWRRICFTFVGQEIVRDRVTGDTGAMFELANPPGYMRTTTRLFPISPTSGTWVWDNIKELLFQGTEGVDWMDIIDAKTDPKRLKIRYDKTRRLYSNNEQSSLRKFKLWHPMNATLTYNDEEQAGGKISSPYSANVTSGTMGDYYIIDLFRLSSSFTGSVSFAPESTLYWHER